MDFQVQFLALYFCVAYSTGHFGVPFGVPSCQGSRSLPLCMDSCTWYCRDIDASLTLKGVLSPRSNAESGSGQRHRSTRRSDLIEVAVEMLAPGLLATM